MSHRLSSPVRYAAMTASTAAVLWLSAAPSLAHPAPEPNYAASGGVMVMTVPSPSDSSLDPRQLAAGTLAGVVIGAGLMAAGSSTRRLRGHHGLTRDPLHQ